jgi:hypothetical protein
MWWGFQVNLAVHGQYLEYWPMARAGALFSAKSNDNLRALFGQCNVLISAFDSLDS